MHRIHETVRDKNKWLWQKVTKIVPVRLKSKDSDASFTRPLNIFVNYSVLLYRQNIVSDKGLSVVQLMQPRTETI